MVTGDNHKYILLSSRLDISMFSVLNYSIKFLDLDSFNTSKIKNMIAFMYLQVWNSPLLKARINKDQSFKNNKYKISLIQKRDYP